ncbi:MAG: Nudix family hydrolase [Pseudomonadaceae bacterium]|nr:Nudix family hydrolase [Pseudomonadaceae bacterium]
MLVAAAAIVNEKGQVLIARRPAGVDQSGLWELPGGKLAPYETGFQALRREIREELGIEVIKARPLIRVRHTYSNKTVLLDVWKVLEFTGEPWGKEGQPIRWVAVDDLVNYTFPAANKPIIKAVQLPEDYLITGEFASHEDALARLNRALEQGIKLVQLRAHHLDAEAYRALAQAFLEPCQKAGAKLMLNAMPELLKQVDADGIHLTAARLSKYDQRPVPIDKWLAASCHDTSSITQAENINVDFITLSPVLPTPSHPEAQPLYWNGFDILTDISRLPVYALGGMSLEERDRVFGLGGQGLAGISQYWS